MNSHLTREEIRDYHVEMSHDSACRAYAGMVETGELSLDDLRGLIPGNIFADVEAYFRSKSNTMTLEQAVERSERDSQTANVEYSGDLSDLIADLTGLKDEKHGEHVAIDYTIEINDLVDIWAFDTRDDREVWHLHVLLDHSK